MMDFDEGEIPESGSTKANSPKRSSREYSVDRNSRHDERFKSRDSRYSQHPRNNGPSEKYSQSGRKRSYYSHENGTGESERYDGNYQARRPQISYADIDNDSHHPNSRSEKLDHTSDSKRRRRSRSPDYHSRRGNQYGSRSYRDDERFERQPRNEYQHEPSNSHDQKSRDALLSDTDLPSKLNKVSVKDTDMGPQRT
jgi:hypothetical protein